MVEKGNRHSGTEKATMAKPVSLAALRRDNPKAYEERIRELTLLKEGNGEEAAAETVAEPQAKMSRAEELELMKKIRDNIARGEAPGITDKDLLTQALFFTVGTVAFSFESRAVMEKVMIGFLEYGARPVTPKGRTLRQELEFAENRIGLEVLNGLGV